LVPQTFLRLKSGLTYPIPAALVKRKGMAVLLLPKRPDILAGDVGLNEVVL